MWEKWIFTEWSSVGAVLLGSIVTYSAIIAYVRFTGLRSFSKMSASDFAMTVAVGSLFASTIASPSPPVLLGLTALAALFLGQWLIATLRHKSPLINKLVDNRPLLLMRGTEMLEANLRQANVTHSDVYAKLREASVLNFQQIRAVVFETTGDISVLHSDDDSIKLEPKFLENVIDFPREKYARTE